MSEMMKLAEIVEGLEGADTALDLAIWRALHPGCKPTWGVPSYTASLDAAMQLVAKGAMRRSGDSAIGLMGTFFCDIVLEDGRDFHAIANSESCAIVSAALKARAHLEGE